MVITVSQIVVHQVCVCRYLAFYKKVLIAGSEMGIYILGMILWNVTDKALQSFLTL